jgi:cytochrome c-type biogenesis protein CcmH
MVMRRWKLNIMQCLFTLGVLVYCTNVGATAHYPFAQPAQQAQFQALLHDLRCPVCQNQDLADSNADLAADLRSEVYHMVLNHRSDQDIIQYLTDRYGDFIVFKPPVKEITTVLWFGPFIILLFGLGLFSLFCIRRVRHD